MTRRRPPRKVTWFEPVLPRLARNTVIESTFEVLDSGDYFLAYGLIPARLLALWTVPRICDGVAETFD
jgi:hypothetical protein